MATTGPDLVAKPGELERVYNDGKAMRPCIIFIDEADVVLKDRAYSQYTEVTNKLLTIMEGVDDAVKDVIFVAATNNPNQIDPVLLRTGRFTGKIEFTNPGDKEKIKLLNMWLKKNPKANLMDKEALIAYLCATDISQANLNGVLQNGLNNAIRAQSFNMGLVEIKSEHIESAQAFLGL